MISLIIFMYTRNCEYTDMPVEFCSGDGGRNQKTRRYLNMAHHRPVEPPGLTTLEAVTRLYDAVKKELELCQCHSYGSQSVQKWMWDAYHHKSAHSTFRWTSAVLIGMEVIAFILYFGLGHSSRATSLAAEIFFLLFILILNIYLVGWDSMLRHREMHSRAATILKEIKVCITSQQWDFGLYPHLHMPQSPCISIQWTHRDGHLVNLPCSLLVEGDIITMRPGHHAPGKCSLLDGELNHPIQLESGSVFSPIGEKLSESFSNARFSYPVKPARFVMLETPYVCNLRLALKHSLLRPVTLFSREQHTVIFRYLECIIIPIVLAVVLCVGAFHTAYLAPNDVLWPDEVILRPALSILPLLPLALPVCWILLNAYGMAHLLALVQLSKTMQHSVDPFDEMEEILPHIPYQTVRWAGLRSYLLDLLLGKNGYLWRSANLLQVLGSITALCCIDKKGILSWPNPTAEKVFFLKPQESRGDSEDNAYFSNASAEINDTNDEIQLCSNDDVKIEKTREIRCSKVSKGKDLREHMYHPGSQVEVLDLTHNVNTPFGLEFDDTNWKKYILNLKPLGLGILLNTCNPSTQEQYSEFCDHIACESLYDDAAVPVVNKRCLCELARQIGFTRGAVDYYQLQQHLAVFRHVRPEVIQKGRLARSLNFPRLKMPFSNMSCAVIKDLHRGTYELFSQGTADLVMDACNEYWDGEDICVLTESDRKRILDFYHRSSVTAHCMAFAYCHLSNSMDKWLSDGYVELPPDSSHLFPSLRSLNSSVRSWDHQSAENRNKPVINRYLSTDSLLLKGYDDISNTADVDTCLEHLGNEIFIGMVTMQYQACPDFVQLIEQLDKACIRFVHFSKENELRSRVFSEKMGLESGWNCHISLLSERNRMESGSSSHQQCTQAASKTGPTAYTKRASTEIVQGGIGINNKTLPCSVSAPSLINLEVSTVKFEDEISMYSKSDSLSAAHSFESSRNLCLGNYDHNLEEDLDENQGTHLLNKEENCSAQEVLGMDESNLSHSPSHITESTDQSAPVTFDMSNRAKLPKGIENIRPHIENVDNVPLLVSLFTDCTPKTTKEMICIMQEYGEVVCCIGSSASYHSMLVFLQADVSIATEPLYPQLCMQHPVFESSKVKDYPGPTELSRHLNSLPCSLSFHREDPVSLYHLILQARHFMGSMRNSLQFMLCCCLSLTLLQLLAAVFFLPLPLSPAHLLWLICLEVPILSLSLLGNPVDSQVMTVATGKNLKVVSKQTIVFFFGCYCAKFCPSVVVAVSCFACVVAHFCHLDGDKASGQCWVFLNNGKRVGITTNDKTWQSNLALSQNILAFLLMVYFAMISIGFVHRSHLIWRRSPLVNKCWIFITPLVIVMQAGFSIIDVILYASNSRDYANYIQNVPFYIWLLGFLWPVVLIPLNEIVKQHEIKMNVRQQKRARLEFGTKLGMNSPF